MIKRLLLLFLLLHTISFAATNSGIDETKPVTGSALTSAEMRANFSAAKDEIEAHGYYLINEGTSLQNLATTIGSSNPATIIISEAYTLTASATITSNITLDFKNAGKITLGDYNIVCSNCPNIKASDRQIFNLSGSGTVSGLNYINPLWLGVVVDWDGSTGTDNSTALQAALTATAFEGTIEFPPTGPTKGISFATGLTLGPHGKRVIGNNVIMKYTGTGNGFLLDGDNARAEDIVLIGNASATSAFKFTNNNGTYFRNLKVYGTGGIAFDVEGGLVGGVLIHCGVDYNMGVHDTLIDEANWGGNPDIIFKLREHTPSVQHPNSVTFIAPQLTLSTGNLTGIGFDISAGSRISIINGIFQNMATGVKVYDAGYVSGYKPIQVNLINPHFEPGTITTYIDDEFASQANNYGLGVDIVGDKARWSPKDFGAGEGEVMWVQARIESDVTNVSGKIALKGNTNTGSGVKGVATGNAGKGIHGYGMGTPANYSGYFENGSLYTTSWYPKVRTITDNYDVTTIDDVFILINAAGKTVRLPNPDTNSHAIYTVKLIFAATTGTVTTVGGAALIDGATTYSLSAQYKYVTVQSDGTRYNIIANN